MLKLVLLVGVLKTQSNSCIQDNHVQPKFRQFNYSSEPTLQMFLGTETLETQRDKHIQIEENQAVQLIHQELLHTLQRILYKNLIQLVVWSSQNTSVDQGCSRIYENGINQPLDMNEIIQDTRCYTILGLEMLLLGDSSSDIWISEMIQSGIGDSLNLIKRFISFSFWDWTNYYCTNPSKLPIRIRRELGYPTQGYPGNWKERRSSRIPRGTRTSGTRMSRLQRGT